jgi:hypothetical protein
MKKRKIKRKRKISCYGISIYTTKNWKNWKYLSPKFFIHPTSSLLDDLLSLELRV